ncbi:MAG: ATP-binding cassette domain-containing protein [Oscillospiraceae bacterium]|jgi:putative ABC transport system ATP-binding protein|nr:ATP-binding cassette domain-containing protein [Oscillospiraceae bacterium]MCI2035617.1 ATP-binding cassette domain-containing protein [Oscillospiraceae bacterium]
MSTQPRSEPPQNRFVEMRHIAKTFNPGTASEVALFRDFSLSVKKGGFVSVVGSNGSGKTTVLNILCGNIAPDAGTVTVGGKEIGRLKEYRHSRFIGRVFQDPAAGTCPRLTILENLSLADNKGKRFGLTRGVSRKRTDFYRSQLELLRLGLEDKLDAPVAGLSGGQRQALALLICTMAPLELLVLDEHTAALDPKSSENVMELTDRFIREKHLTALMVTHNLKYAVEYGDRLIMMHRGHIVLDADGGAKQAMDIRSLTEKFDEISIEDGNSI